MKQNDYLIRLEKPEDYRETEILVREAFYNVYRPGCLEHYVLHTYRNAPDFVPELDFVMEMDGQIVGQNMFVRTVIHADDGREIPIMTMGPICIHPELQRTGLGKILLDYSLERAAQLGAGAVCFEGNIQFYGKSGFVVASTRDIHYYAEPRENEVPYFLLKELKPGYLNGVSGVYETPKGYFVDEAQAMEFDNQFPSKEKLVLPGQLS